MNPSTSAKNIIEELMLMSHTALYYQYSNVTDKIDELIDFIIKTTDDLKKREKEARAIEIQK